MNVFRNHALLACIFIVLIVAACWWTLVWPPGRAPKTLDEFVQALDHRDPAVRMQARIQIIFRTGEQAVPRLIELLDKGSPTGRFEAAVTLCRVRGKARVAAVPGLTRLLQEGDLECQRAAVETLASMGADSRAAVPELEKVLMQQRTNWGKIRPASLVPMALVKIQHKDAVPFLVKSLDLVDSRLDIVMALESLGSPAQAAVPALKSLAAADPSLRAVIDKTLLRIGAADGATSGT